MGVVLVFDSIQLAILSSIPTIALILLSFLTQLLYYSIPSLSKSKLFRSPIDSIGKNTISTIKPTRTWKSYTLSFIAFLLSITAIITAIQNRNNQELATFQLLISIGWIYSTLLPLIKPTLTPPYLLFGIYILHLTADFVDSVTLVFNHHSKNNFPLQATLYLSFRILACLTLIGIVLSYPLVPPTELESTINDQPIESKEIDNSLTSPEEKLTLFGWITFTWVSPLLERSALGRLEYSDIWKLSNVMKSEGVQASAVEFQRDSLRLIPLLAKFSSLDLSISLSLGLLGSILSYSAPYFLQQILTSLSEGEDPNARKSAYVFAALALIFQLGRAELDLQQLWFERRMIIRTRSLLMGMVYKKALKRRDGSGMVETAKSKEGVDAKNKKAPSTAGSTGKIVQLMSQDTMRVSMQLMSLSSFFSAPFELVIGIFFLYQLLGWTAIAGISVMAISLPLNNLLVKRRIRIHKQVLASRDRRMEVLNEFILSIRFIKYSASETSWLARVFDARNHELSMLLKTRLNSLFINIIWSLTPDLISLIAFICYTKILGKELTVPIAFTSLALFALIRSPLSSLPSQITGMLETYVSVQRMEVFLDEPEVESWVTSLRAESCGPTISEKIGIDDGHFVYQNSETQGVTASSTPTSTTPALAVVPIVVEPVKSVVDGAVVVPIVEESTDPTKFELKVSVDFPVGKLSIITGPTGSGKTSLLLALLGEMDCLSGKVNISKETSRLDVETGLYDGIAYCAQLPWLQGDTIRNNILFGAHFDSTRYEAVLNSCSLKVDLSLFPAGDETEIGEKGITLSGGQKARIALARAVYSRAKTVLLDDPLAAVDVGTAKHLFNECIRGSLMINRTIILITHHTSLCLPKSDYLVKMASGSIAHQGFINALDKDLLASDLKEDKEEMAATAEVVAEPTIEETLAKGSTESGMATPIPKAVTEVKKTSDGKLVAEEERATGRVKLSVYQTYLSAAGYGAWLAIFILLVVGRVFRLSDRFWFKIWGESYHSSSFTYLYSTFSESFAINQILPDFPSASDNVDFYLIIYGLICVGNVVISVLSIIAGYVGSFRAARLLFKKTLTAISKAPFRYWDSTPTGRILNRFSGDFAIVDSSLTDQIRVVATQSLAFLINVGVIVLVSPSFVPFAIVIIVLYVKLSLSYVRTSRDLRRLESNARSPIYQKFGETLSGIVTARAFSAELNLLDKLFNSIDAMLGSNYASAMANRYLLFRFDFLGAIAVGATTVLALMSGASPGLAAVAITSAQSLVSSVYWLCRWISALEVDLNAVERVTELLETPQEPPHVIDSNRPPAIWPSSSGGIIFDNLTLSYAPHLPAVIKNVSFTINPREKVGIVGRTGSGKSTLAMALLRFVDPTSGTIIIDGIDVTKIGLADLRSKITLISQEATIFAGTIRSNIDPFTEYSDEECLDVLSRVEMNVSTPRGSGRATPINGDSDVVDSGRMMVTLDTPVSQGGHNFSAGQRQLLALSRAILRRSRIVIMDESTASIDFETDKKIQTTIREENVDSIVLCIAHRLRTIIDYDKILVLGEGNVLEYDTPKNLLMNPDSAFRLMCSQSSDWEELQALAGLIVS